MFKIVKKNINVRLKDVLVVKASKGKNCYGLGKEVSEIDEETNYV